MSKQRRTFSAEFKQQAASLVLDKNYSHIEASRSVGVGETALRRWVNQLHQERQGITPQGQINNAFRSLRHALIVLSARRAF
jgi:transposase